MPVTSSGDVLRCSTLHTLRSLSSEHVTVFDGSVGHQATAVTCLVWPVSSKWRYILQGDQPVTKGGEGREKGKSELEIRKH